MTKANLALKDWPVKFSSAGMAIISATFCLQKTVHRAPLLSSKLLLCEDQ